MSSGVPTFEHVAAIHCVGAGGGIHVFRGFLSFAGPTAVVETHFETVSPTVSIGCEFLGQLGRVGPGRQARIGRARVHWLVVMCEECICRSE